MKFIKEFFKWFVIINTGILLVLAFNTVGYDRIPSVFLWEVFIASAATSLITAIFFSIDPKKEMPRYLQILAVVIHYVCLLIIMIVLGKSFGWIALDGKGIVIMALSVAGVYICTTVLSIVLGTQEAKKMNEALNAFKD